MSDALISSGVSAHQQILNLMYRYGECVDLALFDELGKLFEHGAIRSDRCAGEHRGDAVRRFYAATNKVHPETGTLRTRHLATNPILDVDERVGRATCRSYFVVCQQTASLPLQPIVAGRYHDSFHVVDGRWAFDIRMIYVDLIGDISEHLSFDLRKDAVPDIH